MKLTLSYKEMLEVNEPLTSLPFCCWKCFQLYMSVSHDMCLHNETKPNDVILFFFLNVSILYQKIKIYSLATRVWDQHTLFTSYSSRELSPFVSGVSSTTAWCGLHYKLCDPMYSKKEFWDTTCDGAPEELNSHSCVGGVWYVPHPLNLVLHDPLMIFSH